MTDSLVFVPSCNLKEDFLLFQMQFLRMQRIVRETLTNDKVFQLISSPS